MSQRATARFDLVGSFSIKKGTTRTLPFILKDNAGVAIDLSTATLSTRLRASSSRTFLATTQTISCDSLKTFPVELYFSESLIGTTATDGLAIGSYWYDVLVEFSPEDIWCPLEGELIIRL